jgi:hypothetical protein
MGRRYEVTEWFEFFANCEPSDVPEEVRALVEEFEGAAAEAYLNWWRSLDGALAEALPAFGSFADAYYSWAYNVYASCVGHGVGLWDGGWFREYANLDREDAYDAGAVAHRYVESNANLRRMADNLNTFAYDLDPDNQPEED